MKGERERVGHFPLAKSGSDSSSSSSSSFILHIFSSPHSPPLLLFCRVYFIYECLTVCLKRSGLWPVANLPLSFFFLSLLYSLFQHNKRRRMKEKEERLGAIHSRCTCVCTWWWVIGFTSRRDEGEGGLWKERLCTFRPTGALSSYMNKESAPSVYIHRHTL